MYTSFINEINGTNNNMITLTQVKSALVSAGIAAVLGVAGYILSVGDIFQIDIRGLSNVAVLSFLTAFVTVVSLIKSAGTTRAGTFAGVQIKK